MSHFSKFPLENTLKMQRKSLLIWSDSPDIPHLLHPAQRRNRNNTPALLQPLSERAKLSACTFRCIHKPTPSCLHRSPLTYHMRKDQREQPEREVEIHRLIKQFRLNRCHLHRGIPDHEDREEIFQGVLFLRRCLEVSQPLALHNRLDV